MPAGNRTVRATRARRVAGAGTLIAIAVLAASCSAGPSGAQPSGTSAQSGTSVPAASGGPGGSTAPAGSSGGSGASIAGSGLGASLTVSDNTWTDSVNPAAIPLGDGKVSTTPRAGYVDSCTQAFRGGGAQHAGPWITATAGTWNSRAKPSVQGRHLWSAAAFSVSVHGSTRVISTNDLPVKEPTGSFPIATTDPAYQFDHNPNSVLPQNITLSLPANPTAAAQPTCTGLGPIGVTSDGVLLFNALDASGRDAGAHEIQDTCHGHPNGRDEYHYHSISDCLLHPRPNTSELIGYALDGYGIYAEWNAQGKLPTNADLGACHGRTSTVLWNGKKRTMYHYDVTLEYPYTVGCFHGTPVRIPRPGQG